MSFEIIHPTQLTDNVFDLIKLGMPLLTAEHHGKLNTMTVNWGQLGYLWNRCVSTIYVRPQRYTFPLVEGADCYSLSFLPVEQYHEAIMYCGSASGRDGDKLAHCNLTAAYHDGVPYLEQAELVLICKKRYTAWMDEDGFLDADIAPVVYEQKDYHKMYIGEITAALRASK